MDSQITIHRHWREHLVLEANNKFYRVDGEGLIDGSWVIYGYTCEVLESDFSQVIDDHLSIEETEHIISLLKAYWDSTGQPYSDTFRP